MLTTAAIIPSPPPPSPLHVYTDELNFIEANFATERCSCCHQPSSVYKQSNISPPWPYMFLRKVRNERHSLYGSETQLQLSCYVKTRTHTHIHTYIICFFSVSINCWPRAKIKDTCRRCHIVGMNQELYSWEANYLTMPAPLLIN